MTTINTTSLQSATLRRAGFTPPTTDQLRALVARRLSQPGIDATSLSGTTRTPSGLPSINDARQGLGEVAGLLDQLKEHVGRLAGGTPSDDAQHAIDDLVSNIDDAAQRSGLADHGGDGFGVLDVARQVTNLSVYGVHMAPGQEQKVEIDVRASAQQAGLFMDLTGGKLEMAAAASEFKIEVGGRNGKAEFTFHSGDTAEEIAKAINDQSKTTGVEARVSGSGVRMESIATGSAEFTSVKVLDNGGAADTAGHFFRFKADNAGAADPDTFMTFDSIIGSKGIRDLGQDADVWVNGQKAAVYGSEVLASNDKFKALFFLDRLGAAASNATPDSQHLGTFTGFTINADGTIVGGDGAQPTPAAPNGNDPTSAQAVDGVHIQPPPQLDYGADPGIGPDAADPKNNPSDSDAPGVAPPQGDYGVTPKVATDGLSGGPVDPVSAKAASISDLHGPDKKGDGGGGNTPLGDLKDAAGGGSAIDPDTVRVAIDKLLDRVRTQNSALDLIERAGLDVVPASVGAAGPGSPGQPELDYGSALNIAKSIRQSVFDAPGRVNDFGGGTTSAQVLRLLGADGTR